MEGKDKGAVWKQVLFNKTDSEYDVPSSGFRDWKLTLVKYVSKCGIAGLFGIKLLMRLSIRIDWLEKNLAERFVGLMLNSLVIQLLALMTDADC
jgi:hypothetical protein